MRLHRVIRLAGTAIMSRSARPSAVWCCCAALLTLVAGGGAALGQQPPPPAEQHPAPSPGYVHDGYLDFALGAAPDPWPPNSKVRPSIDPRPSADECRKRWNELIGDAGKPRSGVIAEAVVLPPGGNSGQPITLLVSRRNLNATSVPMTVPASVDELLLQDDEGRPIPFTVRGYDEWIWSDPGEQVGGAYAVKPGFALGARIHLGTYFDLSRPGTYHALIITEGSVYSRPLVAAPVTFKIPEPSPPGEPPSLVPVAPGRETSRQRPPGHNRGLQQQWNDALADASTPSDAGAFGASELEAALPPTNPPDGTLIVSLKNISRERRQVVDDTAGGPDASGWHPPGTVRIGKRASDYTILLREASGKFLTMSDAGHRWCEGLSAQCDSLAPGDALGFTFPLGKLFALAPGREYSAIVVLPTAGPGESDLATRPLTFSIPAPAAPGLTRQPYASPIMWRKLEALRHGPGPAKAHLAIAAEGSAAGDLCLSLENTATRPIHVPPRRTHWPTSRDRMLVLVRDASSATVAANESAGQIDTDWAQLYASSDLAPGQRSSECHFPLRLAFPLVPGRAYTALAALMVPGVDNAMALSEPLDFTAPCGDGPEIESAGQDGHATPPPAPEQRPAESVADRPWAEIERFAGKPCGGLVLQCSVLPAGASSPHRCRAVRLLLRNMSDKPLLVLKWKGDSDCQLAVHDAAGRRVAMTEKGRKLFDSASLLDIRELRPGDSIDATLRLDALFDLAQPGEYEALASLPVVGDVDAILTAAPVKFRVGHTGQ